jgi:hypothetical protein
MQCQLSGVRPSKLSVFTNSLPWGALCRDERHARRDIKSKRLAWLPGNPGRHAAVGVCTGPASANKQNPKPQAAALTIKVVLFCHIS